MPLVRLMMFCLALPGSVPAAHAASDGVSSPHAFPSADDGRIRIVRAGSLGMGRAENWLVRVAGELADATVVLLYPHRVDWNPAWQADSNDPEFVRPVQWELQAQQAADIIPMSFAPGSQSAVPWLEMGLRARSGRLLLAAPERFWRQGSVVISTDHNGVSRCDNHDALIAAVHQRVAALQP